MGGYGSGRQRERPLAEELPALRVRDLRHAIRAVTSGGSGHQTIMWTQSGRTIFRLHCMIVAYAPGALRLLLAPSEREAFASESLALSATPQHLGGQRWWFLCPACARRAGMLFLHVQHWRCRRCIQISYQSSCHSDKRLGPLLEQIAHAWAGQSDDPLDGLQSALIPLAEDRGVATARATLAVTQPLRLLQKAEQLAFRRFQRGVPISRNGALR